jgi:hypothetical protein
MHQFPRWQIGLSAELVHTKIISSGCFDISWARSSNRLGRIGLSRPGVTSTDRPKRPVCRTLRVPQSGRQVLGRPLIVLNRDVGRQWASCRAQ